MASSKDEILLEYGRVIDAFRGLGILMGQRLDAPATIWREERCTMNHVGMMLDASRNGVPTVATLQRLIRHFGLLGINSLMLYTEDTYEIPGEPLFGYFRGRYTHDELLAVDAYAASFGMEVIPCIQTLGHLGQMLRWPAYAHVRDTSEVLLAGEAATDRFVRKMIEAASAPFRSRRIHVGMDEAHGIGTGRYRLRNGYKIPFDILTEHLQRVAACCQELDLQPMIWSDMYFRLGSESNAYYDRSATIPAEVSARIPGNVDLVYWDYYHREEAFYEDWIGRHRAMGKEPVFAAGIWTWSRFWAALPHSLATLEAGMMAANEAGLHEAFITLWGDDGMECDLFSALPAVARFADLAYGRKDRSETAVSLRGACGIDLASWMRGSGLDCIPGVGEPEAVTSNHSKWLLWHDPVYRFLGKHISKEWSGYYRRLTTELGDTVQENANADRLRFPAKVAEVLAEKLAVHEAVETAYAKRDVEIIHHTIHQAIPRLEQKVRQLWQLHRGLWHELYKPFGWEVLERRYATLLARLETLRQLLDRLEQNPSQRIEEFEQQIVAVYGDEEDELGEASLTYASCSSPSIIL